MTNSRAKANILNEQFFKNFNNHSGNLPGNSLFDTNTLSNLPDDFLCSEDTLLPLLTTLDVKKSTGADGISALMLKNTAHSITPSLSKLFNLSIKTGKVPRDWKFARVVPIPKSGDRENPANYRPISILPVISKILERHFLSVMTTHLNTNSPLSSQQWGFTAGKSTTAALISFSHDCLESLDGGKEMCSVFFDLSKAFDSVPHLPLLNKLKQIGLSPFITKWIESYLSGRLQLVVLDGVESSLLPVISGVPQGSILGPLLFLIYIDKAANCVSSSSIAMYADDIALYRSISSQSDYSKLQDDVNSLCYWISHNHLKLNVQKCCYMTFSRKHSPTLPNSPLTIEDNFSLSRVDVFKYLGVNFSSDFSWTKHITSTCNKSRKLIGMLHRSFYKYSKPDSTSKLYKSLIRPHLEYASAVWSPHLAKDIKLLEDTQKFALKVCTKKWDENYETLLNHVQHKNASYASEHSQTLPTLQDYIRGHILSQSSVHH